MHGDDFKCEEAIIDQNAVSISHRPICIFVSFCVGSMVGPLAAPLHRADYTINEPHMDLNWPVPYLRSRPPWHSAPTSVARSCRVSVAAWRPRPPPASAQWRAACAIASPCGRPSGPRPPSLRPRPSAPRRASLRSPRLCRAPLAARSGQRG